MIRRDRWAIWHLSLHKQRVAAEAALLGYLFVLDDGEYRGIITIQGIAAN